VMVRPVRRCSPMRARALDEVSMGPGNQREPLRRIDQ
jgi:hypothetical protein